jgi:hypothetical protein
VTSPEAAASPEPAPAPSLSASPPELPAIVARSAGDTVALESSTPQAVRQEPNGITGIGRVILVVLSVVGLLFGVGLVAQGIRSVFG